MDDATTDATADPPPDSLPGRRPAPPPDAESGRIRGASAHVRLSRPLPPGDRFGLEATLLAPDGGTRRRLLWSAPSEAAAGAEVAVPLADLDGAADGSGAPPPLVRALWPVAGSPDGAVRRLAPGPGYDLGELLPHAADDVSRLIFSKDRRYADPGTLDFVLRQVLRSPLNAPVDKIEAVKVLAYRAMESSDPRRIGPALELTAFALDQVALLADEFGVNKGNRYKAVMSIWYIQAHLHLLDGDVAACRQLLERVRANLGPVGRSPLVANNSALGLIVLGYIKFRQGEVVEAVETWEEAVALFRVAARHFPLAPPKKFAELAVCFRAATFCAFAADAVRKGRPELFPDLAAGHIARSFLRLRKARGAERAQAILESIGPPPGAPAPTYAEAVRDRAVGRSGAAARLRRLAGRWATRLRPPARPGRWRWER